MECVDCGGRGACRTRENHRILVLLGSVSLSPPGREKRGGQAQSDILIVLGFVLCILRKRQRKQGVFWSLCRMCLPGWFVALWRSTEESAAIAVTLPICKNGILEQYATNDVDRVFIFSSKRHEFVLLGGTTEPTKTRNAPCSAARLRLLGHFLPSDAETQDFRPTTSTQASAWFWKPSRISCITMHDFL